MEAAKTFFKKLSGLLIGIIVMILLLSIFATGFFSLYNIGNILKDFSILLVVSIGMTMAILLGKIDVSVGSIMSMAGIVVTVLLFQGFNIVIAVIAALLSGLFIGLVNGILIGRFRFDYFIVTFATMAIAHSLALIFCKGTIISVSNPSFMFLGSEKIGGIHLVIWIALLLYLVMVYVLNKTSFGYKIYSIGGSEQVSLLEGINPTNIYIKVFALGGVLASISGIFLAAIANTGNANAGTGYEFTAMAAVLMGGTPFDGGRGGLKGTLLGALFISILKNGLNLLGLTPPWQYTIIGLLILIAIVGDVLVDERKKIQVMRRIW